MYDRSKRSETAAKYDMTVREQRPGESDIAYFRALAKQADQRLVRLEKYAGQPNYGNLLDYAYSNAMYDIRALTGDSNATRFNRIPAKTKSGAYNQQNLHAKINAVKRFLESPTSTKRGITKVYKQRADTINKRYGTNMTWQEMAAYYSSSAAQKIENEYKASKSVVRALGALRRIGDDPEQIEKAIAGDIKVSNDAVVNEIAVSLLQQGYTYSELTQQ